MNKYNYIINTYNISVDIDAQNLKYYGKILINFQIIKKISDIKINSSKLKILSIKIISQ